MSHEMIFADSSPLDESSVLEALDRAIDRKELDRRSTEAGFSYPTTPTFDPAVLLPAIFGFDA
jgi:hypothetical protein